MTLEKCTTPDAPFYHADLILLEIFESNGIDLPCHALVQLMLTTTAAVALFAFCIVAVAHSYLRKY